MTPAAVAVDGRTPVEGNGRVPQPTEPTTR